MTSHWSIARLLRFPVIELGGGDFNINAFDFENFRGEYYFDKSNLSFINLLQIKGYKTPKDIKTNFQLFCRLSQTNNYLSSRKFFCISSRLTYSNSYQVPMPNDVQLYSLEFFIQAQCHFTEDFKNSIIMTKTLNHCGKSWKNFFVFSISAMMVVGVHWKWRDEKNLNFRLEICTREISWCIACQDKETELENLNWFFPRSIYTEKICHSSMKLIQSFSKRAKAASSQRSGERRRQCKVDNK